MKREFLKTLNMGLSPQEIGRPNIKYNIGKNDCQGYINTIKYKAAINLILLLIHGICFIYFLYLIHLIYDKVFMA